jgi:hypothetical protein
MEEVGSCSVYPWRNLSLLLITFNSATGTPLEGSYTVTLKSLKINEWLRKRVTVFT